MAFIISFVGLFIFLQAYESGEIATFSKSFSQESELTRDRIFIIGDSPVRQLNQQFIQNFLIEKGFNNIQVYEMGQPADNPSKRIRFLEEIIEAEPTLVVYGLSPFQIGIHYPRDPKWLVDVCTVPTDSITEPTQFDSNLNTEALTFLPEPVNGLPSVQNVIADYNIIPPIEKHLPLNFENPKLTVMAILNSINEQNVKTDTEEIPLPDEKLFNLKDDQKTDNIHKAQDLKMPELVLQICLELIDRDLSALDKIVTKLKEEKIKVIVFQPPFSQVYLDFMGEDNMKYYNSIVNNFASERNLPLYSLTEKYIDLDIWRDWAHVAENPEVTIYNTDIAKFIIRELGP